VGDRCAGAGRHDRGQKEAVSRRVGKPDREHASVQAVEPTSGHPAFDAAAPNAQPDELPVGDDTVLARREPGERHVGVWAVLTLVCGA
jgi:hypothetical protein